MEFLQKEVSNLFPAIQLNESKPEDFIRSKWAGIRPLVLSKEEEGDEKQDDKAKSSKDFSRKHLILESDSGLISVMGGKWTIYRLMGEETLLHILKRSNPSLKEIPEDISTRNQRFIGDFRGTKAMESKLKQRKNHNSYISSLVKELYSKNNSLGLPLLNHLARNYGVRSLDIIDMIKEKPKLVERVHPGFEVTKAEVVYQIKNEMVVSVFDLLLRRSRLAFLDKQAATEALPILLDLLGNENGWDDDMKRNNLKESRTIFEKMDF